MGPMHQRRKIILLFGAGIVLPSLLLSYLAFRGVQNDRALVERDRLEATRRAADKVLEAADKEISDIESALSGIVKKGAEPMDRVISLELEKLMASRPVIEQVFVLRGSKDVRYPAAELSYLPDGRREPGPSSPVDPGGTAGFEEGQRLEFRLNDYAGALAAYRRTLERAKAAPFKGKVLNAMARVQKKSGLLREAISTYEAIARDHADIVLSEGMPLGPSAALEACLLSRDAGDIPKALKASFELYRSLIRPRWVLEKAEYRFFLDRAAGLIGELLAGAPPDGPDIAGLRKELQALEAEEGGSRARTERLIVFREGAAPALAVKSMAVEGRDGEFKRLALNIGSFAYFVSVGSAASGRGGSSDLVWGLLIDAEAYRDQVVGPALRRHFPAGGTSWSVTSREGTVLLRSDAPAAGPVIHRTNFPSSVPDWSLEFQQPPPHLIKTFLLSRRGLYFFVFLLIAGILVFGLVLTTRSVSRELELARMKSDFVSTVSHEFKSPLTSIRQLAEMLQSGRVPSEERRQQYYDVLLEQSERLALLTDNILSLAKIEEGRAELKREPTDVGALLTEVVGSFQERVRHEGFDIELKLGDRLPRLALDRTALSQAVTNLVDNAVKYSGDSRKVTVDAFVEGPSLTIAVRDFGIGIRKADIDRVFERFFRGGAGLTRTVKGSGLGLTLVREIVEAHGGKVHVASEPGKGSVFSVRLPIPPGEEA
jgi:signal transduction histidine kinase/tetratricopeptide (TPR) repeat protein